MLDAFQCVLFGQILDNRLKVGGKWPAMPIPTQQLKLQGIPVHLICRRAK